MSGWQRWAGLCIGLSGLWLLAGPGWALLCAGGLLAVVPPPWQPVVRHGAVAVWVRYWGRVRGFVAAVGSWCSPGRLAGLALPAGVGLFAVGAGLAFGPGAGVLSLGGLLVAGGLMLDRRSPDPDPG